MAIKHIAAIIEEASQYPSAMVAIDLDSISQVHKEVSKKIILSLPLLKYTSFLAIRSKKGNEDASHGSIRWPVNFLPRSKIHFDEHGD